MTTITTPPQAGENAGTGRTWPPPAGTHAGTIARRGPGTVTSTGRRPAPRPIDGALLWCYVRKYLSYYVAFRTEEELDRVTAWVFHASARKRGELGMGPLIWNASPRLLIKSRTRGAGKSTALRLVTILTGSKKTPRITAARFAQLTGQAYATVCIDEGRLVFGAGAKQQDLQACLLDGYTPGTYYEVSKTSLHLFGAAAFASKESLITDATKAVDGDESSIGDLLERCLTATLTVAELPPPEVGKRAEADGAVLCRALVAWTDTYRDALEQAAEDIADEDYTASVARAERGEKATETPRALQIGRPLRAVGRVIDQQVIAEARRKNAENPDPGYRDPGPQCEAAILACLGTQAEDIMAELEALAPGWEGGQFTGEEDEPGIVTVPEDEPEPGGLDVFAQSPPAAPQPPTAAPAGTYKAGYATTYPDSREPVSESFGAWPSLFAAKRICEAHAGMELPWNNRQEASITGDDGAETFYAVRLATERSEEE